MPVTLLQQLVAFLLPVDGTTAALAVTVILAGVCVALLVARAGWAPPQRILTHGSRSARERTELGAVAVLALWVAAGQPEPRAPSARLEAAQPARMRAPQPYGSASA